MDRRSEWLDSKKYPSKARGRKIKTNENVLNSIDGWTLAGEGNSTHYVALANAN